MFIAAGKQCYAEPFSGKGPRSWIRTELEQLNEIGQRDTLYHMTSCRRRVLKEVGVHWALFHC